MKQVTKNVYVETEMMACNIGFVTTRDGLVLIDTPMKPSDAIRWRDEAKGRGEIRYLINTEEHPDHWQGSFFFPGILITHEETRKKLKAARASDVVKRAKELDPQAEVLMKDYKVRLADITMTECMNIYLGNHTIKLFHLPGHSDGGIGVYIPEEHVVFTTDIVFHKKKSWLHESDPLSWISSLRRLSELDIEVVVPGHGELCKKDYFSEQSRIIQEWIDTVKTAIKRGWSLEEAKERLSSPDPYPKQSGTPMTEAELNREIIARLYRLHSENKI